MISEEATDILAVKLPSVILSLVNCLGYGSVGLMNKIMKKYPKMFNEYHDLCGWHKDFRIQDELMGKIQGLKFPDSSNILCNAFSQRFYSDTKYEALPDKWEICLRKVKSLIKANFKSTGILYEIHAPAKLGIGMNPEEIESLKEIVTLMFGDDEIKFVYHI